MEWFGEKGRIWCDALPGSVAHLSKKWKLSTGAAYDSATHALVLECVRADGSLAVLKLPFVDDENRAEADALRLYDGDGAVRLLDHDPTTGAMLLERLVPGTALVDLADRDSALDIACAILRRLRRPAPPAHRFPLLRDLADAWTVDLPAAQNRLSHPLPGQIVNEAAQLAHDLGSEDGENFVVNRDAHLGNFLAARREPWLLIDPKPVVGEAAFGGSFLLLANLEENATRAITSALVERISDRLGVDPRRLRVWAQVRAVDSALWACSFGNAAKAAASVSKRRLLADAT
ncbi:MAG: aminoglycoside phosphotransferase family protein [Reyranellales bacterium]